MNLEQLTQRHARLQQDLATAYDAVPWNAGEIDRLADDLASTEREIAALTAGDRRSDFASRFDGAFKTLVLSGPA